MRPLLDLDGPDPRTPEGLHARYWPERPAWVRANFVASLDGAATVSGRSGGLGGAGDHRVFATLRDHADVILVGAGTVRAENYGPVELSPGRQARRIADGRREVPRLAVVGRSSSWRGDERWLTQASDPPLLLTGAAGAADVAGAETVVCGQESVGIEAAMAALGERGLRSVLCEGGPGLFTQLATSGRLDEVCLTVAPTVAGPGSGRIVAGDVWSDPYPSTLTGLLEEDGFLFCRYRLT